MFRESSLSQSLRPTVTEKKPVSDKATLRNRVEEWCRKGEVAGLGAGGRLVLIYLLLRANWRDCTISMSERHVAGHFSAHRTTISRGIRELEQAGILRKLPATSSASVWAKYEVCEVAKPKVVAGPKRVQARTSRVRTNA